MKRRPSMNRAKHGKILEEHLKDRELFTMNNLSTTFRIPKDLFYKEGTCSTRKGLGLQGKDLSYKEKTCPIRKELGLQGKDLSYKEKTWATRKRLVLQGKDLGYKERRQDLTTIKAPTLPHIKVRIIDPSLAL